METLLQLLQLLYMNQLYLIVKKSRTKLQTVLKVAAVHLREPALPRKLSFSPAPS